MLNEFLWQWVPWLYNSGMSILDTLQLIYISLYKELTVKKEWAILKDTKVPLSSQQFSLNDISDNTIRWRATINPPVFIDPRAKYKNPKHISYLGFSVNIPGLDPIDISDWINEVKWIGIKEPTPLDIFTLWCCKTSNPLFHILDYAVVEIITEMGDTVKKGLNEFVNTTVQENDRGTEIRGTEADTTTVNREDPNRVLDAVLSSSGC
jgi:hypothetical protein